MANAVNVDFITKVVEIEVNDNQPESLAAQAAINAAARADLAADLVVENVDATLAAIDDKTDEEKAELDAYSDTKKEELEGYVNDAQTILKAIKNEYGYPFTAATAAAMTDPKKIYVYTGSEVGYTAGNWYYHNGTTFVSGGVYNSTAFETDDTLAVSGMAADAKVVGTKISAKVTDDVDFDNGNLLRPVSSYVDKSHNGVLYTWNDDFTQCSVVGETGNAISFNNLRAASSMPSTITPGETYYLWFETTDDNIKISLWIKHSNNTQTNTVYNASSEFTVPSDTIGFGARLEVAKNTEVDGVITKLGITGGLSNKKLTELVQNKLAIEDNNAFELYTEFEQEAGWWTSSGSLTGIESYKHNKPVRIRPNTQYYRGYKIGGNVCYGAFFNAAGKWIAPLLNADLTEYSYQVPNADPNSTLTNYVPLYTFTSPPDAYYYSYNMTVGPTTLYYYRNYVCSKPLFAMTGTGNYVYRDTDALYQKFKDKKLCVIGASGVMIDRLYREGNLSQYIVGYQEYLMPFFAAVDSYGYSGASWKQDDSSVRSIYSRVVTDQLDLSGYDVFVLGASGNGLTADSIGSVSAPSDLGDEETYVGGMRHVIDYIYTQNPQALIYVANLTSTGDNTTRISCNEAVRNMANLISCPYIDLWQDTGINAYNREDYSYDNGNHMNQIGSQIVGLAHRKAIIGF